MIATSSDLDMHSDDNMDIRDILLHEITIRNAADMVSLLCDYVLDSTNEDQTVFLFNAFEVKIATIQYMKIQPNAVLVVWNDLTFRNDQPLTRR